MFETKRYRKGAVENTIAEKTSILLFPNLSAKMPAGMLVTTPVKADTEAINPTPVGPAPKWAVKIGRTGLLDMVELNMAKRPVVQRITKGLKFIFSLSKRDCKSDSLYCKHSLRH